ncbi:DUF3298 and DUF4163 domain-containing protein [Clostridium polynesiense]|uniref:DUF3298 and DUF4163 domain-containing protein n=1 Tax=Clostridium polynesiense TaxID=1325933 RepID=UPI000693C3E1|nr:DUF3298 and DUF4163 domain-containing protein [Clostridium polynesiense]
MGKRFPLITKIFLIVIFSTLTESLTAYGGEAAFMDKGVQISTKTIKETKPYLTSELNVPVISLPKNKKAESNINNELMQDALNFKGQVEKSALENYENLIKAGVEVRPYEVLTKYKSYNLKDIISLAVTYYQYSGGAHGIYSITPYNYDAESGERLNLKDIFKGNYNYKEILNDYIQKEISKNPDNYFKDAFKGIRDNQEFYITKDGIVIFFQVYEIAPFAAGNPEFVVPYSKIQQGLKYNLAKSTR